MTNMEKLKADVAEAIAIAGKVPFAQHSIDTQVLILDEATAALKVIADAIPEVSDAGLHWIYDLKATFGTGRG